jgi:hypothetical protein
MMSFKRVPLTLLPILLAVVVALLFIFHVPSGGDLISSTGDIILGAVNGALLCACFFADLYRFGKLTDVRKEPDALAKKSGDQKK